MARVVGPGRHVQEQNPGPGVRVTTLLDGRHGCPRLCQRVLEFAGGGELTGRVGGMGESWYVEGGSGTIAVAGQHVALYPGTAVWMKRGGQYRSCAEAKAGLRIVATEVRAGEPADDTGPPVRVATLAECVPERTGDREFRVLLSAGRAGNLAVTQFVGVIPPGRAPAHHHTYDEAVYVLDGEGEAHVAEGDMPIGPGTSIYLPPYTPHCLENTGSAALRVLGLFYPAGSPAAKAPVTSGS
jgi:mannose-6-phosphate isomerase-like protein (cupin superfamily)